MFKLPFAVNRIVPFQFFKRGGNRYLLFLSRLQADALKTAQLFYRAVNRGIFKAHIELYYLVTTRLSPSTFASGAVISKVV